MSTNYRRFIGRRPYASEMFGIYRPMIGWASKRKRDRILDSERRALAPFLRSLLPAYWPRVELEIVHGEGWISDNPQIDIGAPAAGHRLALGNQDDGTFLLPVLEKLLDESGRRENPPETAEDWQQLFNEESLRELLKHGADGTVGTQWYRWQQDLRSAMMPVQHSGESNDDYQRRALAAGLEATAIARSVIERESCLAAAILDLVRAGTTEALTSLFYTPVPTAEQIAAKLETIQRRLRDPFLEFDPTDELNGVTVTPIGIVHLYRQYFFEFDAFLGPPVEHYWLPPGGTLELVESSTRKSTIERITETEFQSTTKTERDERLEDELSAAIKTENRNDSKLGFSTTVTQSWPAGSATATGSLNLDTTQQMAREETNKRLREQSTKLSTEIRNSFKTTFRTVTETTDVTSKRYVLQNSSQTDLQNFELRRKMRQVGVQVQDVGSYLCWETFVDDPGLTLGLADMVHVAKPPDVTALPGPAALPTPERKAGVAFQIRTGWNGSDQRRWPSGAYGIPLGRRVLPIDIPDGYRIDLAPGQVFDLQAASATGEDSDHFRTYTYRAQYVDGKTIDIGLAWGPGGLKWSHDVAIELTGTVALVPTEARLKDIADANAKKVQEHADAMAAAQAAAWEAAFYKAAQERIEQAASVKQRRFEDLREEERTVVYRELIRDLMAKDPQAGGEEKDKYDLNISPERRHVYATVLNAIFDIDAMLYFVAPEWWKPRARSRLSLGDLPAGGSFAFGAESVVGWSDRVRRDDNYYITSKSAPARLGSSLGWLLQLDGDDNRNRFLNAPWVRAVIPIRPGKEEAAIQWLSRAGVEGVDGLDNTYAYPDEGPEISAGLAAAGLQASVPPSIRDAITYLCLQVADKHRESSTEALFPDRDAVANDDKVWSTPIEKVYEHGFYPLERSFRANPNEEPVDTASTNFQILAQWTEILPTDQIVPVPVAYDPLTGRLKAEA